MPSTNITIPIGKHLRENSTLCVRVEVSGLRVFKMRMWCGLQIMRLAAFVIGMPLTVDVEEQRIW